MKFSLYEKHLKKILETTANALSDHGFDCLVLSSGEVSYYFADDRPIPFKTVPHFAHWCPAKNAGHLLKIEPGKKPKLVYFAPDDFWHANTEPGNEKWLSCFDVTIVKTAEERFKALDATGKTAFIGNDTRLPQGYHVNPVELTKTLDWQRSYKTEWEIDCLDMANRVAARGHGIAVEKFLEGATEFEIYLEYLKSLETLPEALPYSPIIGIDENAAVLHYEHKSTKGCGNVLLIDAGFTYFGYGSDITRTTLGKYNPTSHAGKTVSKDAYDVFSGLIHELDLAQKNMWSAIKVGSSYKEVHRDACLSIFDILKKTEIIKTCPDEEVWKLAAVKTFFPHGLGHMLGIQVHDVAGKQLNIKGDQIDVNGDFPYLRNYRTVEKDHVFTIEPGIYFIQTLLDQFAQNHSLTEKITYNDALISELMPFGGIRIEDNIAMKNGEPINLTRKYLP